MTHVHFLASKSHKSYLPGKFYSDPDFIRSSAERASNSLWIAALMFALASGLFALLRRSIWAVYAMVLLAVLELWFFTRPVRPTFDLMQTKYPALAKMTELRQGDYRIFNTLNANSAMTTGTFDILGHDPGMLRRYSEFMYRTQRLNPDRATQSITCSQWHRLFAILRLRYVISYQDNNLHISALKEPPLPRLLLIDNYEVLKQRDEIFDRMFLPDYDFRSTVILESEPKPVPQPNAKDGSVKIVDETTDSLVIEADLSSPSILLVTDAYHPYWRIRSLVESTQDNYKILPANYILRAVPLSAGYHRFIMEYRPPLFNIGKWLTLISLSFYVLICGFFCYKKFRRAA
jgi:hypothetical protein